MDLLRTLLLWLDAEAVRFWLLAWMVFGLAVASALCAPGRRPRASPPPCWWQNPWLFIGGVFLTLAAFRWPTWFVPGDLNPDEAQMIAGAITLRRFPVYWKYVDGTTHGPLCEYLLLAASWLGAPLGYFTARTIAALLQAIALVSAWGTLRCFTSERTARLAVLPGLAFWSFVSFHDYINYASELPGIALLALAGWGIAMVLVSPKLGRRESCLVFLCGVGLGTVPFAKLQSTPQAATMALIAFALLWRRHRQGPPLFRHLSRWFALGGVVPTAVVLVFLAAYGLWGQFHASYILSNLGYTGMGQHPLREMPGWFFHFAATGFAFAWFLAGSLAFALLYARSGSDRPVSLRTGAAIGWALFGIAYACVILPGREATHYLHLLVIPTIVLAGFILALAAESGPAAPAGTSFCWLPVLWFGLLTLLPQIYCRAITWHEYLGGLANNLSQPKSAAAEFIMEHAQPGDTLAMWGWEPALYVETGLAQGTREAHTACQLTSWPLQPFYIGRFLRDMQQRQPAWFVDAVGPEGFVYEDRTAFSHEKTPLLRELIAKNYMLLAEFRNKRIYHLKDAVAK